jgi:hypothetical protein
MLNHAKIRSRAELLRYLFVNKNRKKKPKAKTKTKMEQLTPLEKATAHYYESLSQEEINDENRLAATLTSEAGKIDFEADY